MIQNQYYGDWKKRTDVLKAFNLKESDFIIVGNDKIRVSELYFVFSGYKKINSYSEAFVLVEYDKEIYSVIAANDNENLKLENQFNLQPITLKELFNLLENNIDFGCNLYYNKEDLSNIQYENIFRKELEEQFIHIKNMYDRNFRIRRNVPHKLSF